MPMRGSVFMNSEKRTPLVHVSIPAIIYDHDALFMAYRRDFYAFYSPCEQMRYAGTSFRS